MIASATHRRGFSLLEILITISIIAVLLGLLLPAIGMLKRRAREVQSVERLLGLTIAVRSYRDEDPRGLYPTPEVDGLLRSGVAGGTGVMDLLELAGYQISALSLGPADGGGRPFVDGWQRPFRYHLDGPYQSGATLDASRINGVADRPAADPGWNPRGEEPFPYLWSLGEPRGDDAVDADPGNHEHWLYPEGSQ